MFPSLLIRIFYVSFACLSQLDIFFTALVVGMPSKFLLSLGIFSLVFMILMCTDRILLCWGALLTLRYILIVGLTLKICINFETLVGLSTCIFLAYLKRKGSDLLEKTVKHGAMSSYKIII